MLRIFQSTTASDAKSYFTEALGKEDYYTADREIVGNWGGVAGQQLGLSGPVDRQAFARLCDNQHPATGQRLTPRTRDDRTVGYDLSFHAPKGISVLHALSGDDRIVEAFRDAVQATMAEIEAGAHTRVRLGNRSEDRHTGNLVWGEFTHFTTRPVGGEPDPQLHIHAYVFNATYDSHEARWKAGQFRPIVRDHPYFEAIFHSRLAHNIESIGYPIARNIESWDVDNFSRQTLEKFSRRTQQIESAAKRLGITDPVEKAELGARTRAGKARPMSADELARRWQQRLSADEAEQIHRLVQLAGLSPAERERARATGLATDAVARGQQITPAQALDHAIGHVFARKSVESDKRLLAEALRFGVGHVLPEQLHAELASRRDILSKTEGGETLLTTREVLLEEQAVLRFAVDGKGTRLPLGAGRGGREGRPYSIGSLHAKEGLTLNTKQHAAVQMLLESRDRVMILRGGAGTGKTTTLKEAAAAIRHGGTRIFACAVTADASRGVLRDVGFDRAETLEKLLRDPKLHNEVQDQVIWVDEAGMVGTPTMKRLFDLAEKTNARVVLSGDTKQHPPVERGESLVMVGIQSLVDRAESERIKERVARGKREKALNGLKNSGPAPYGYRNPLAGNPSRGVLQIVPSQASVVRRIFDLAAAGDSTRQIAQRLNAEAIPSPRGGQWGKTTIKRILENIAYTGTHVSGAWQSDPGSRSFKLDLEGDSVVRVDEAHEAIVPQALWNRVHSRSTPATAQRPRLLTGLLWMNGHAAHGDTNRGIAFYRGPRGAKGAPWVPVTDADRVVWEAACSVVRSPDIVEAALLHLETQDEQDQQRLHDLTADRQHLTRLESRLDGLIAMRADGELTKSEFTQKSAAARDSIAAIKKRLATTPQSRPQDRRAEVMKLVAAARVVVNRAKLSPSDQARVLRSLASRIDLTAKREPAKQLRDERGRLKTVRRPPWLVEQVTLHIGDCEGDCPFHRDGQLATAC